MKGFYLSIDSILDARFGAVSRINPDIAKGLIAKGYHQRKGDFFEGIDPEEYRSLYEKYEVETLMESTVTNVFQFLQPQVADVLREGIAQEIQHHLRPVLDVNVWPYAMTADEMAYLRTMVYARLGGIIGVNVFSRDLAELTPQHCAESYLMMVMYDYHHYLNAHSEALIKNPKPTLMLVGPMVYFNRNPETDEETIEHLKRGINSLALLEAAVAARICLKFVNVDVFSIVYPDDRLAQKAVEVSEDNHRTLDELEAVLAKQREQNKDG